MEAEVEVNEEAVVVLAKALFMSSVEKSDMSIDERRAENSDAWRSERKNYIRRAKRVIQFLENQNYKVSNK